MTKQAGEGRNPFEVLSPEDVREALGVGSDFARYDALMKIGMMWQRCLTGERSQIGFPPPSNHEVADRAAQWLMNVSGYPGTRPEPEVAQAYRRKIAMEVLSLLQPKSVSDKK